MKKGKKLFALLSAAAIGVASLAGCGAGGDGSSDETTTLKVEIFERGDVPAGGGTITDNELTRWIQKEFGDKNNIKMDFVSVPRQQESQQLNVLMAAGEAPDIVFTYSFNLFYKFYKQGGLTDLTEYVDKAENLKSFLGEDVLESGRIDGKQVLIPAKRMIEGREAQLIRQDWLDKLGMKAPTNTEEFYQVLKAFKEKDPGNVGEKLIPWGISMHTPHFLDLVNTFVETDKMTEAENAVTPPNMKPGFKEGIRFMNKLYNEGLISPDFALDKDRKQMEAAFSNGYVGFVCDDLGRPLQSGGYYGTLKQMVPTAKLTAVDTWTDKNGKTRKEIYPSYSLFCAVPKNSKNAEAAVKYLDWMSQPDVLRTLQFGWEGKTYTTDSDGYPKIIETDEAKKLHWYNLGFDTALVVNGKFFENKEKSVILNAKATGENQELYMDCYANSVKDGYVPVALPSTEELEKYSTGCNEKYNELLTKSIMAAPGEFDRVYDSLQTEFEEIGGKQILEASLKRYEEFYGKK